MDDLVSLMGQEHYFDAYVALTIAEVRECVIECADRRGWVLE